MEKRIKSVKKNGVSYTYSDFRKQWESSIDGLTGYVESVCENTILNCPLFEIEYYERWRAGEGEAYETVTNDFNVLKSYERYTTSDNIRHKSGNYFKPGKAQEFADFCKENIWKFHYNEKL